MKTEGVSLSFADDAIDRLAAIAAQVNERQENIGARRLHTVLERLLDTLSFEAPDKTGAVAIDRDYVDRHLGELVQDQDLSRYSLWSRPPRRAAAPPLPRRGHGEDARAFPLALLGACDPAGAADDDLAPGMNRPGAAYVRMMDRGTAWPGLARFPPPRRLPDQCHRQPGGRT